jgi:hypothetical protein
MSDSAQGLYGLCEAFMPHLENATEAQNVIRTGLFAMEPQESDAFALTCL